MRPRNSVHRHLHSPTLDTLFQLSIQMHDVFGYQDVSKSAQETLNSRWALSGQGPTLQYIMHFYR